MKHVDTLIIGAGAAGLFCAIQAAKRGRSTLLLEKSGKPGRKILMSGGGRCNFTNRNIRSECYLSQNPHFMKSALARYTQWDFIAWVESHNIPYHEKMLGQLFCDGKARVLVDALLQDLDKSGAKLQLNTDLNEVKELPDQSGFVCETSSGRIQCESLVVATGGLSIPSMGTTPFAYQLAESFNIPVRPTRAGLVPFTVDVADKNHIEPLSGVSFPCELTCKQIAFQEDILLTHRGLSGPAALQLSSYWKGGESVGINCLPGVDLASLIEQAKKECSKQTVKSLFFQHLPKRLVQERMPDAMLEKRIADISNADIKTLTVLWCDWQLIPSGTEGYRTAEVTLGGVDTSALSSKTMAVKAMPQLYFIGEAVDVTGWLGGYNFQWAWSSAWVAGQIC